MSNGTECIMDNTLIDVVNQWTKKRREIKVINLGSIIGRHQCNAAYASYAIVISIYAVPILPRIPSTNRPVKE